MVDIDTKSGIEYGRGVVKTVLARDVIADDLDAERRVCDYLINGLGYRLLNRTPAGNGAWLLHFIHTTLLADTDRGDQVALDGRWEAGDVDVR